MTSGFEVRKEMGAGKVTFRLFGTVDGAAARTLQQMVLQTDPKEEVVVDFAHVQEFFDLSVAVLTRTVAQRPVQLTGLRSHQARMFEYFGIRTEPATDRAYYTPEDVLNL